MEEQILMALKRLIESGALDNIQEPGKQTLVIYGLLIALTITLARIFLINGWLKKGLERFFSLEERKLQALTDLNTQVKDLQKDVQQEHEKLSDVMRMLQAKRHTDAIERR